MRVAVPALGQEDPLERGVAVERDPHAIPGLALLVVGAREAPAATPAGLAVVRPHAQAQTPRGPGGAIEQLVGDREALVARRPHDGCETGGRGMVEVALPAPRRRAAPVASDALAGVAEVVGGGD